MKFRIRLLALSTLLVTLSNFNFSFPTLAANSTQTPKCSQTPTFRDEFTNSKQPDLSTTYAYNILVQRLISTALPKINNYEPSEAKKRKNLEELSQILKHSLLVANTIDNPRYKAEALSKIAAFYSAIFNKPGYIMESQNYLGTFKAQSLNLLYQSWQLTNTLKNPTEKIKLLSEIASIYTTIEELDKASKILTQILEISKTIKNVQERAGSLYKVVEQYLYPARILQFQPFFGTHFYGFQEKPENRINRLSTALQIANKIEINNYKFIIFSKIANEYVQLKYYNQALQISRNIQDNSLKGEVLYQIIQSSASNTINQEGRVTQHPYFLEADIQKETLNETLTKAFQVINEIKDVNSKDIVLGELACGYIEATKNINLQEYGNKWLTAFAEISYLIDQGLIITNNIQSPEIKSKTLSLIAFKLSNLSPSLSGNNETRIQLIRQLRKRSLKIAHTIPNEEMKYKTLGVIAFNIFKASKEFSRDITEFNEKTVNQFYREPFQIIAQIKDNNIKSEILSEIALDFTTNYYFDLPQKKYSQALQIANTIQQTSTKQKAFTKIAENYVNKIGRQIQNTENKDRDLALLSQVLQIAKDPSYESALRPMIANLYLEVGEIDRAFELVKTLDISESTFNLLADVAKQYAIDGKNDKSNSIFTQILQIAETKNNAYQKATALHKIATAFRDSGRYEEASEIITQASLLVKTMQYTQNIPVVNERNTIENGVFSIFYPRHKNPLSDNRDDRNNINQMYTYVSLNDLVFRIDRLISELNLRGQYQPTKKYNHNLQRLIAESKYEEALELVQQSRSRLLIDLINRPSTLLSYTPEYFKQLNAHPTPPPPQIDQIRKIAKERQATLVEYAIVYRDNQTQNITQNSESELFIWVVKPTGEVAFRRVNLSFFGQQNIWLAQLASNPQLFVRGLMQELKVNPEKVHPVFLAIIIFTVAIAMGITLWHLRLLLSRKAPLNRWVNLRQLETSKTKNIPKQEVNFLYSYSSNTNLNFQKLRWRWLFLTLVLTGGGGVFLFGKITKQKIITNRPQDITVSRDKVLSQNPNQNQQTNKQTDNSLLANLVSDSRESMGVRGRGLGLVPQVEKSKQTSRLQQLHQLLIAPIADLLPTDASNTVIFIPTKSLFFVAFPALQDREGKYLIQKHTILTAPSIQVLDLARKRRQKIQQSTNKDVLVVGNPTMPILVSADGKSPEQLSPLPGAEQEARAIASLLNTQPLIGSDATEPVVMARMLKARIIHIATHGLLDPIYQWKESPGAIALAPLQDNSSIPLHELKAPPAPSMPNNELLDGFFSFYNSYIPEPPLSAELVVLSACDTGRGQLTEDGIVGLSRSFITAGVPSLIVSLWAIPDASTASLMTEFYRNWQNNGDKAQALRQAMLTTMKQYPEPRNWAAFTLIGEAK